MKVEERIRQLEAENAVLRGQLAETLEYLSQALGRIQELEGQLAKDSHNSSKPLSSDGPRRKRRSQRQALAVYQQHALSDASGLACQARTRGAGSHWYLAAVRAGVPCAIAERAMISTSARRASVGRTEVARLHLCRRTGAAALGGGDGGAVAEHERSRRGMAKARSTRCAG